MSRRSNAAAAVTDPTPTPASAERCACHSLEELPPELRGNPFVEYILSMKPEEEAREIAAVKAHQEAEALYGDDPERILAAIEAGTHPLKRSPRSRG